MLGRSKKLRKHREPKSNVWKILHVRDYKSLVQPYLSVLSISGFFPYKNKSSKYVFSWMRFVWSVLVMMLYTISHLLCFYELNVYNKEFLDISIRLRSNFFQLSGYLVCFINYFTIGSKIHVLEKLSDVSRTLSPLIFRKLSKRIFVNNLVTPACLSGYLLLFLVNNILYTYIGFYTLFVTLVLHTLYIDSIYVLEACLEKINESLMKMRKTLIADEPHLLRRVYHMKKNGILIREVKILREQYLHIREAAQLINDASGSVNIGIIGFAILYTTFAIYDFVYLSLNNFGFNAWLVVHSVMMVCYFGNLIRMIWTYESVGDQARKVGSSIHQTFVTTFDEQLSAELESFSMQVLQQDVSFSVLGLAMDATLLAKVVSIITTYLLILIEFLILEPC